MANDDGGAEERWIRTVVDELRRFHALRPHPSGVRPRFAPLPPELRARMHEKLGALWPLAQSTRDGIVSRAARRISGAAGLPWRRYGFIPEPEASRIAVAADAEAFAAVSAYAAGKSVATDEERSDLYRMYAKEVWASVYRYEESRAQAAAATSSRSGRAGSSRSRGVGGRRRARAPAAPGD
uniref:WPP domain-containing protein n=1 Tax=Leersia perrieri TaxID=77586 RepID=A0A0D9WK73_9ORYZ